MTETEVQTGARQRELPLAAMPAAANGGELAVRVSGLAPEMVEVLRKTVCAKFSENQLLLFLAICRKKQVDPFTEAYGFPGEDGGLAFGLRIDGMRALAHRTGEFLSRKVETIFDKENKFVGARATIERSGMKDPVVEEAYLQEYDRSASPKFNLWKTHAETMIRKVAESKALRAAFADALSGVYEPAEMKPSEEDEA